MLCCAAPRRQCSVARGAFTVVAKQNATQRIRLSEKERMYNKARKSAVATRMKKVGAVASLHTPARPFSMRSAVAEVTHMLPEPDMIRNFMQDFRIVF